MTDENRITELLMSLRDLVRVAGSMEHTHIIPNAIVINASPTDLPSGYIIVSDDSGGYIPAVTVPGATYENSDKVNLFIVKGTEPIAFQHGSESAGGNGVSGAWPAPGVVMLWDVSADTVTEYASIVAANASADNGDSIVVGAGTFDFPVTISKNISLIGAPRNSSYIRNTATSGAGYTLKVTASGTVNISNFKIDNGGSNGTRNSVIDIAADGDIFLMNCLLDIFPNNAVQAHCITTETNTCSLWIYDTRMRAAQDGAGTPVHAINCLQGWIEMRGVWTDGQTYDVYATGANSTVIIGPECYLNGSNGVSAVSSATIRGWHMPQSGALTYVGDQTVGIDMAGSAVEFLEMTEPSNPGAGGIYLYAVDNGGKTELKARFPSGAGQQVAIEP